MKKIKQSIKKLYDSGFFAIYLSTILTKVVVLFGGVFIVRLLSIKDYATYTLVNNAFSMLNILGDFGTSSALLIFLVQEKNNESKYNSYLRFGIKYAVLTSLLSGIVILLSPLFYPYKNNTVTLFSTFLFLIPFFNALTGILNMILRSKDENRKYSIYQVVSIIIHYIVAIGMILLFGLKGSIICQYIYSILIIIVGIYIIYHYKIIPNVKTKEKEIEKKSFVKLAISSQLANLTSTLLYSIDIFVIALLVTNTKDLSIYKVSTVIPSALVFLPNCLMVYLLPKFIKNNKNEIWIRRRTKQTILYGFPVYLVIFLSFCLFSKYIFLILYGEKYINSMYPFLILMVGFLFNSTINVPVGNIICALKKPSYNTIINIISLIFNVVFNYIFIKKLGYIGASITTTLIIILSSILSLIFYKRALIKNREVK